MIQLQQNKLGLGCKFKNGQIQLDTKTCNELQIAMHVCGAAKAILVFANINDLSDFHWEQVAYDFQYFEEKLEQKLKVFFENTFIKEVVKQDIHIKN